MSRLMIGLGLLLDGSIGLLSMLSTQSSVILTIAVIMISGLLSSLALHCLSIIIEANALPKVLEMEADASISWYGVDGLPVRQQQGG